MSDAQRRTPRASGADVVVLADRVIKRQDPAKARCERERSEWGERVGRESRLFRAPRVLSHDAARGEIVFERLDEARPLAQMLRARVRGEELMQRTGRALAAIHEAESSDRPHAADEVSLHGDFGCGNVFYREAQDQLWIIDWCTSHWLGVPLEQRFASPSLDLGTFLISLFYRRTLASYAIPEVEQLARGFLCGYSTDRAGGFPLARLRADLPEITRRWEASRIEQVGWLRVALYHPSLRQLLRFVQRVELHA